MKKPDQPATFEHHPETASFYVRVSKEKIKRTFEVDPDAVKVVLDLDQDGELVGIEILGLVTVTPWAGTKPGRPDNPARRRASKSR